MKSSLSEDRLLCFACCALNAAIEYAFIPCFPTALSSFAY